MLSKFIWWQSSRLKVDGLLAEHLSAQFEVPEPCICQFYHQESNMCSFALIYVQVFVDCINSYLLALSFQDNLWEVRPSNHYPYFGTT